MEFKRWFGSSVVTDTGKPGDNPLTVYHGTGGTISFDVFQSHGLRDVYELDGEEIVRADSWNMGEFRKDMPEAYHFLALSWTLVMGAENALAQVVRDSKRVSSNSPDTRRLIRDLERLCGKELIHREEIRPSGNAFFFTPDAEYSFIRDIGYRDGGYVIPVYLSIKNPIYLNASAIEGAGYSFRVEEYKKQGYDGAIYAEDANNLRKRGWNGCTQIVAFYPEQIKSAIGNCGMFEVDNPSILAKIQHGAAHSVKKSIPFVAAACANGAKIAGYEPFIKGSEVSVVSFKNADGTFAIIANYVFRTQADFKTVVARIMAASCSLNNIEDIKLVMGSLEQAETVKIYSTRAEVVDYKAKYNACSAQTDSKDTEYKIGPAPHANSFGLSY